MARRKLPHICEVLATHDYPSKSNSGYVGKYFKILAISEGVNYKALTQGTAITQLWSQALSPCHRLFCLRQQRKLAQAD